MRKLILLLIFSLIGLNLIAQSRGRLKRLDKAPKQGAVIIAGPDSLADWDSTIVYLNGYLIINGDTVVTQIALDVGNFFSQENNSLFFNDDYSALVIGDTALYNASFKGINGQLHIPYRGGSNPIVIPTGPNTPHDHQLYMRNSGAYRFFLNGWMAGPTNEFFAIDMITERLRTVETTLMDGPKYPAFNPGNLSAATGYAHFMFQDTSLTENKGATIPNRTWYWAVPDTNYIWQYLQKIGWNENGSPTIEFPYHPNTRNDADSIPVIGLLYVGPKGELLVANKDSIVITAIDDTSNGSTYFHGRITQKDSLNWQASDSTAYFKNFSTVSASSISLSNDSTFLYSGLDSINLEVNFTHGFNVGGYGVETDVNTISLLVNGSEVESTKLSFWTALIRQPIHYTSMIRLGPNQSFRIRVKTSGYTGWRLYENAQILIKPL